MSFHGQDIPYEMYCNETAVLEFDTVYKQSKNYHPRYMLKCVNTLMQKASNLECWVIQMKMDIFKCKRRHEQVHRKKKAFVN